MAIIAIASGTRFSFGVILKPLTEQGLTFAVRYDALTPSADEKSRLL
jgi:hypothetical protein